MDEKKSFFELLNAAQALVVGVVGGTLILGTFGFIILGGLVVQGKFSIAAAATAPIPLVQATAPEAPAATAPAQTPPPPSVPKSKRPRVELFVMSYCPFGLQMEKAYAPAWELLKNKADIDIKFVSYAMHEIKEVQENTRQYCIEKDQGDKYISYLKCFTASGDAESCMTTVGVNQGLVDRCYSAADKKFGVMAEYNDKSKWLSGRYPIYPIYSDLNQKYGVQGSPTLVINGVQAEVTRTPEAVKQAICAAFDNPPAECNRALSALSFGPGFGTGQQAGGGSASPGCGT